jgi:DNA polymerase-3 subunit delta'
MSTDATADPTLDATVQTAADPAAEVATGGATNAWGVHGQDHAVAALRRAIASDQLAHAYLLVGPEGVGKATLARRFAQTLACEARDEREATPCLECRTCRTIEAGEAPDVERITIGGVCDETSHDHSSDNSTRIRICQVRRIQRVSSLAPFSAPRRVFVIDDANDLQTEAGHALLKTLEEPAPGVVLVMLATDLEALLPTVRSRCQELVLRPMPRPALVAALEAGGADPVEVERVAPLARGRFGAAVTMLADPSLQVLRDAVDADARRLVRAPRNERFDYAEQLAQSWFRERHSVLATIDLWAEWWRALLLATTEVEPSPAFADEAAQCDAAQATRGLAAVRRAREHLLQNTNPQLALEVMMLDLPVLGRPDPAGERTEARTAATPA